MTGPMPAGWYLDPATGRQRYWNGTDWAEMETVATAPHPSTDGGVSKKAAAAVGACVLSIIGTIMSMQATSLLNGTGTIWTGVAIVAGGVACAFILGAEKWVRILAVGLLAFAVFNAISMEKQLSDRRDEISRMFNPAP